MPELFQEGANFLFFTIFRAKNFLVDHSISACQEIFVARTVYAILF
jgi:hypothetical protein